MLLNETVSHLPIFNLAPWVVFLPLIGLLINLIVGKYLGEKGIGTIASLATGLSFVLSVILLLSLRGAEHAVSVKLADWITVGDFSLSWIFRIDTLTLLMRPWFRILMRMSANWSSN